MTGLPKTVAGNDAIVVCADGLTKYTYVYLVACSKESSAIDWVNMFVDPVYAYHGLSEKVSSDTGHHYTSV